MKTKTIQLGNSEELKAIKTHPRQGWAEAAKEAHKQGDDKLLIQDVFNDETFEDLIW